MSQSENERLDKEFFASGGLVPPDELNATLPSSGSPASKAAEDYAFIVEENKALKAHVQQLKEELQKERRSRLSLSVKEVGTQTNHGIFLPTEKVNDFLADSDQGQRLGPVGKKCKLKSQRSQNESGTNVIDKPKPNNTLKKSRYDARNLNDPNHKVYATIDTPRGLTKDDLVLKSYYNTTESQQERDILHEEDGSVECPDHKAKTVTTPKPANEMPTPSKCKVLYCSARNPQYTMDEFDKQPRGEKFILLTPEIVKGEATLRDGPYNTHPDAPRITVNYVSDKSDWQIIRQTLKAHHFFKSIEERGMFGLDVENQNEDGIKRQGLNPVDVKNTSTISCVHIKSPSGVLLQLLVNYNGQEKADKLDPRIPEEIKKLLANHRLFRFGFGVSEDSDLLLESGLVYEIGPVCELQNALIMAFPQHGTDVDKLKVGKDDVAKMLGCPIEYIEKGKKTPRPSAKPQVVKDYQNWDFGDDPNNWKKEMTPYNHYDHDLGYVLLHTMAMRYREIHQTGNADLLRVEHYILAMIQGWTARFKARHKANKNTRPYPDWMIDSETPLKKELTPFYATQEMPQIFNGPDRIIEILLDRIRDYQEDPAGVPTTLYDAVMKELGQTNLPLNTTANVNRMYNDNVGPYSPHACSRCGNTDHLVEFCPTKGHKISCCYCGQEDNHLVRTCPQLHLACKTCGLRGHVDTDHDNTSCIQLFNNWIWGRHLGFFTCRLAHGPYETRTYLGEDNMTRVSFSEHAGMLY